MLQESEINKEFLTLLDKKITLTSKNSFFSIDDEVVNLACYLEVKALHAHQKLKQFLLNALFLNLKQLWANLLKYDIQSEASHKFERFVDPESHDYVIRRFINIVSEHANIKDMSFVSYDYRKNKL